MVASDVAIIGLGTMGENLALNISEKGYRVTAYNRTTEKTREFVSRHGQDNRIVPAYSLKQLTSSLRTPRRILILVKAGSAVDDVISQLSGLVEPGDVLADLGNSHFKDTEIRLKKLASNGVLYEGIGVSGGEAGARHGACFMAGGAIETYEHLRPILQASAADTEDGPACAYLGPGGAGHYVKMVHNGIEYAMLQLLAEAYDIMRTGIGMSNSQISEVFHEWSNDDLKSFLVDAAAKVCSKTDPETGHPLVDLIEDSAEQKGTGKWCSKDAFDLGVPTPTLDVSASQRSLSSFKTLRTNISQTIQRSVRKADKKQKVLLDLRNAVFCSFLTSFAQGLSQLKEASKAYGYNFSLAEVTRVWGGGCIIRARMVEMMRSAYVSNKALDHLFMDPSIASRLKDREDSWRETATLALNLGIPAPGIATAIHYYYSMSSSRLPANLIQGLRDLFGAHGFRRVDKSGQFHVDWR